MPVVGHGFAAVATAQALGRQLPSGHFTLVALVFLAYLPDLASQAGRLVEWDAARLWGHSLVVAAAGAPLLAFLARRLLETGYRQALAITLFSLWLHDALDILQSTDRVPLWPLSSAILGPSTPWLPSGLVAEATLFGGVTAAIWAWRRRDRAARGAAPGPGSLVVAAIIALAALTSHLRDRREADAQLAHYLVEQGAAGDALPLLDQAERWPSPAKPGRIDYLRGAAYNELGDRAAAERFYLLSLRKDPSYFWAVVDLAVFYAEAGGTLEDRRRRAAPYMERLRGDFASEPELGTVLARLERKLAMEEKR